MEATFENATLSTFSPLIPPLNTFTSKAVELIEPTEGESHIVLRCLIHSSLYINFTLDASSCLGVDIEVVVLQKTAHCPSVVFFPLQLHGPWCEGRLCYVGDISHGHRSLPFHHCVFIVNL